MHIAQPMNLSHELKNIKGIFNSRQIVHLEQSLTFSKLTSGSRSKARGGSGTDLVRGDDLVN